jgi:hypothetical protein
MSGRAMTPTLLRTVGLVDRIKSTILHPGVKGFKPSGPMANLPAQQVVCDYQAHEESICLRPIAASQGDRWIEI